MFAGGGTVGVESFILNRKSILIDINPLLSDLINIKTFSNEIDIKKLYKDIDIILQDNNEEFEPKWANINHWYNEKILKILKNLWGNYYNYKLNYPLIMRFALLYISRKFSYSDDNIPKLYKSKKKVEKIKNIVEGDKIENKIKEEFKNRVKFIYNAIKEFQDIIKSKKNFKPTVILKDTYQYSKKFKDKIDCIITSPPYLQAQEYIRSIKLDLYWYQFDDEYIRKLSKLEIPYRKLPRDYKQNIDLLNKIKEDINFDKLDKKYQNIFNSYFFYTLESIYNYSKNLKKNGILSIFVGSPTLKGHKINIWEIFIEYFLEKGFSIEEVIADPILSKKLASNRNNKNPNGIEYEYLIILRKL